MDINRRFKSNCKSVLQSDCSSTMRQDQDILLLFILSCFVLAVNGRAARRITGKQFALLKRSVANIRLQTQQILF